MKEIPSYVKDTSNFLYKTNFIDNVPEETYLVTMDGKSLYTDIPNSEGILATKRELGKGKNKTKATKFLTIFSALHTTSYKFF